MPFALMGSRTTDCPSDSGANPLTPRYYGVGLIALSRKPIPLAEILYPCR